LHDVDKTRIARLLPHAGDMVLLDEVVSCSATEIECLASSHRRADHPLSEHGALPASAAVEYAAQAIALHGRIRGDRGDRGEIGGKPSAALLAVLREVRWAEEPLDAAPSPLRVRARLAAELGEGAQYAFEVIDAAGVLRASGEAIFTFRSRPA
jgi:predicted hotdog family 3-hydroxylacyl-ACP dehydratase